MWKKIIIGILFGIYCLLICTLDIQCNDVELKLIMKAQSQESIVTQFFWDNGNGYNADHCTSATIDGDCVRIGMDQNEIHKDTLYRIDPICFQENFSIEQIALNGQEFSTEDFLNCVSYTDQVELYLDESGYIQGVVSSDDSKFIMNEEFSKLLYRASLISHATRIKLALAGLVIAFTMMFISWQQVIAWGVGTLVMGKVTGCEAVLARWKAENLSNAIDFYIIVIIFVGFVTAIIFWELKGGRKREKIHSNHEN